MKIMKSIFSLYTLIVLTLSLVACKDDFSVDLSDREFIRLTDKEINITIGERYSIRAATDSLGSASKSLVWTVHDTDIATIEGQEDRRAIVTGVSAGTTVIEVATSDGSARYFMDLRVAGDRVIKILAIGNSFSEDAIETYLSDMVQASGRKALLGNMYIGGWSLEGHWLHAEADSAAYQLRTIDPTGVLSRTNGSRIGEVIASENWDYISFQEVSQNSGLAAGYQEFLPQLIAYARPLATNPDLKFILHQTWAYAEDSNHEGFLNYDRDQKKMFDHIVKAVWENKDDAGVDLVIPAGTAIQNARTSYIGDKFTRDGYHLSLGLGRLAAASTWYEAIFGGILENTFVPEGQSAYDVALVRQAAFQAVENPKEITVLTDYLEPEPNDFQMSAPVYIDFGGVETDGFNNFTHPNAVKLSGLLDASGTNTNFAVEVSQPFTGTLDRGLQNVLGWPQSVSQDMFFTDGIHIAQSGLKLSNLNADKTYTLVFYGSINDDKTETEFVVSGENKASGSLDNDNNLGRYVLISGMKPAADATLDITLKPGPNNTHFARFFGINALVVLEEGMELPFPDQSTALSAPVWLDLGTLQGPAAYNFFGAASDAPRFDLKDAAGASTGIAVSVTDRFSGDNHSGALNNTLGWPQEVSQDALWGDRNNPSSGLTFYNLDPDRTYQFILYGSRRDVNDNRETQYTVSGREDVNVAHDASNNEGEVSIVKSMRPAADGSVTITASAGPNNNNGDRFYYLNTIGVAPEHFEFAN